MASVADLVRLQRQRIITDRVATPSISRVLPESAKQAASKAIASQAIYAGGLSQRQNDVSVSAQAMGAPYALRRQLGALEAQMARPCPTGYVRDGRGECVVVIDEVPAGIPARPTEYKGPTNSYISSSFRPTFDAAVPGQTTTQGFNQAKAGLRVLKKQLSSLARISATPVVRQLSGLGATLTTGTISTGTISTGTISTSLTTQQIIDGLNAQITSLNKIGRAHV